MNKKVMLRLEKVDIYEEDQHLLFRFETDPWTAAYRHFDVEEIRKLTAFFNEWLLKVDKKQK